MFCCVPWFASHDCCCEDDDRRSAAEKEDSYTGYWSRKKGREESSDDTELLQQQYRMTYPEPAFLAEPDFGVRMPSHSPTRLQSFFPQSNAMRASDGTSLSKPESDIAEERCGSTEVIASGQGLEDKLVEVKVLEEKMGAAVESIGREHESRTPSLTTESTSTSRRTSLSLPCASFEEFTEHAVEPKIRNISPKTFGALNQRACSISPRENLKNSDLKMLTQESIHRLALSPLDEAVKRMEEEYLKRFPLEVQTTTKKPSRGVQLSMHSQSSGHYLPEAYSAAHIDRCAGRYDEVDSGHSEGDTHSDDTSFAYSPSGSLKCQRTPKKASVHRFNPMSQRGKIRPTGVKFKGADRASCQGPSWTEFESEPGQQSVCCQLILEESFL